MPHTAARSQANPSYPQRFAVPDEKVPWATPFPSYKPTPYTYARKDTSFSDAPDPKKVDGLKERFSYEGALTFDPLTGAPVNPAGRTGSNAPPRSIANTAPTAESEFRYAHGRFKSGRAGL